MTHEQQQQARKSLKQANRLLSKSPTSENAVRAFSVAASVDKLYGGYEQFGPACKSLMKRAADLFVRGY